MALKIVFNPFTGKFDFINSTSLTIPEVMVDPSSPGAGDSWVLLSHVGLAGEAMGVLGLTYSGDIVSNRYLLSYYTTEGTTVRTELS